LFLGNVDIAQQRSDGSGVTREIYLLHLLRRRRASRRLKDSEINREPESVDIALETMNL
jgi:hypothetical protein